jgi:hypothetical protein
VLKSGAVREMKIADVSICRRRVCCSHNENKLPLVVCERQPLIAGCAHPPIALMTIKRRNMRCRQSPLLRAFSRRRRLTQQEQDPLSLSPFVFISRHFQKSQISILLLICLMKIDSGAWCEGCWLHYNIRQCAAARCRFRADALAVQDGLRN